MSNQQKELYEFGPFRIDPGKRLLLRDNQPVPLQLKAFETLLVLVRNSEQVVLKDDLMKAVWPNTFVEESNLAQNIFVLRKTLGTMVGEQRYIVTIPGRGYSFASKVRVICEEESLVVESHSRTRVVIDEKTFPDVANAAVTKETTSRSTRSKVFLGVAILALAMAAVAFRPVVPPPRVIRFRQLTHLGTLVHNTKLVTDGPRIYFRIWDEKQRDVRYVSTEGGEVFTVDKPIANMDIDDISPSGSEFLEVNLGDLRRLLHDEAPYPSVWRVPVPTGSPQPVGDLRARDARWSPDGSTIAYSVGLDLNLVNTDGSNPRKLATLPGEPFYPIWSPDAKRLRFSVADPHNGTALWQADLSTNTVRPLFPNRTHSDRPWAGGWTPDGKYFFYTALGDWATRNIWAIREDETLRRVSPQPIQITAGPLTFYLPTPSKDGKSVFAVGEQLRGQLMRYDNATRQFVPYAQGISADHITYSRDGQWMAYVEFPEAVLVRSRIDGSERRQLTFPPMLAFSPQWSPDGTQLAFHAKAKLGARNKIYLISTNGGVPSLATPDRHDQQIYPSWTSDGNSILFSGSDESDSNLALYSLDLTTKNVSQLPGTADTYWGQIAPNGKHVVALENISQKLLLYDTASHRTRTIASVADYPRWSPDGQYVYFSTIYWSPHGKEGGVYRWNISTNKTELVTKYPEFLLTGAYGVCFAITPDGDTLMVRDVSTRDLYALDMELP